LAPDGVDAVDRPGDEGVFGKYRHAVKGHEGDVFA